MNGRSQPNDETPHPLTCDCCDSEDVELTTNDRIYGKQYGEWPYIYLCLECDAAVGCHPLTYNPLGKLASPETRALRKAAHQSFDTLWRQGLMTRTDAYEWLASALRLKPDECHISMLSDSDLQKTEILSEGKVFQLREQIQEKRDQMERAFPKKRRSPSPGSAGGF